MPDIHLDDSSGSIIRRCKDNFFIWCLFSREQNQFQSENFQEKFLQKLNSCSLETLTYLFLCIFSSFDLFPTNLPGKGQDRKGFMFLSSFEFFELFDIFCEWKNHWNALWAFDSALNWVSTEDCQNVNYQVSSCVGDRGPNLNKTDEKYWQTIKQITK